MGKLLCCSHVNSLELANTYEDLVLIISYDVDFFDKQIEIKKKDTRVFNFL